MVISRQEYGVQNGPKALKLQMKGAMDHTLRHILCPSKLNLSVQGTGGWLRVWS